MGREDVDRLLDWAASQCAPITASQLDERVYFHTAPETSRTYSNELWTGIRATLADDLCTLVSDQAGQGNGAELWRLLAQNHRDHSHVAVGHVKLSAWMQTKQVKVENLYPALLRWSQLTKEVEQLGGPKSDGLKTISLNLSLIHISEPTRPY